MLPVHADRHLPVENPFQDMPKVLLEILQRADEVVGHDPRGDDVTLRSPMKVHLVRRLVSDQSQEFDEAELGVTEPMPRGERPPDIGIANLRPDRQTEPGRRGCARK